MDGALVVAWILGGTVGALFAMRVLRELAARPLAYAFVCTALGALVLAAIGASVIPWRGWFLAVPGLAILLAVVGPGVLVRVTGGPRTFESMAAAVYAMTVERNAQAEAWRTGAPGGAVFDRGRWRREIERWRTPDTSAPIDTFLHVLDRWPAGPIAYDEDLEERLRAAEIESLAIERRLDRSGVDIERVARLMGYDADRSP